MSLAVLEALLAPYVSSGKLHVLLEHRPVAADTDGDWVRSVTVRGPARRTGPSPPSTSSTQPSRATFSRSRKTEYVTGFESKKQTGELHAPDGAATR